MGTEEKIMQIRVAGTTHLVCGSQGDTGHQQPSLPERLQSRQAGSEEPQSRPKGRQGCTATGVCQHGHQEAGLLGPRELLNRYLACFL